MISSVLSVLAITLVACGEPDGPIAPDTNDGTDPVVVDTAPTTRAERPATLLTPTMYCHYRDVDRFYIDPRDTITIASGRLRSLPEFNVILIRTIGDTTDTLRLLDNRDPATSFWFDDTRISTVRWIPNGRYRVEIVDAINGTLLRRVYPDLEVRSLLLTGVSATSMARSATFKAKLLIPYFKGDARWRRVTAWMGSTQLAIEYSDASPYGVSFDNEFIIRASHPGSGVFMLRDEHSSEETTGPVITITDVPYSKYFTHASLSWIRTINWHKTTTTTLSDEVVKRKDTTFITTDTLLSDIRRGCCDTLTRGDTTKLTTTVNDQGRWQAVIVVDTAARACRSIILFWREYSSYSDRVDRSNASKFHSIRLRDVPVIIDDQGSWIIRLREADLERHMAEQVFRNDSVSEFVWTKTVHQAVGMLDPASPLYLELVLFTE